MTSISFKAILDGVHFDPKKGKVKVQLVGASHISLDSLSTLSQNDEPIRVTLESEQTKIGVFTPNPSEDVDDMGIIPKGDEE